jgi:hypothetical protein
MDRSEGELYLVRDNQARARLVSSAMCGGDAKSQTAIAGLGYRGNLLNGECLLGQQQTWQDLTDSSCVGASEDGREG